MASELLDSTEMITFNRPEADITIVMMEGDTATEQAMIQASILACNHETPEVCTNIINLNEGEFNKSENLRGAARFLFDMIKNRAGVGPAP